MGLAGERTGQGENMPKDTLTTRVTRMEENMVELTAKMNILADAQIKTEMRFQETGERIEKLVSAIGELINRIPPETLR
jgi:hypothetical protein